MASMEFRRQYLTELPLPLAQLYRRTNDVKSENARHNVCYFMFEALVKLVAAPAIAIYLEEVDDDPALRDPRLDEQLQALACPSQGHWAGILREIAKHFGERPGAEVHPIGHLWNEIRQKRRDGYEGLIELYRSIKDGPDSSPSGDQKCSLMDVTDKLVPYRNMVLGHGGPRSRSFYQQKAPLFVPAVNDALQSELICKLWPQHARLIYVEEKRTVDDDWVEMEYLDLTGERGVRMPARKLSKAEADRVSVKRVALDWPSRSVPLRLDPLLTYRASDQQDEVLFLNKDLRGKRVDYLSYTTGQTHQYRDEMAAGMRNLMKRIKGQPVSNSDIDKIIEGTPKDPVREHVEPKPPTGRVIDDFEVLVTLGRGGMGVVYLARQLSLGRLVALKMLPASVLGDDVYLARFQREIRILGQCEHPNIIKILAHGMTENDGPYFAMEYVPGCDLNELCCAITESSDGPISSLTGKGFSSAVLEASKKRLTKAGVGGSSPSTKPISTADSSSAAAGAEVDSEEAQEAAALSLPALPGSPGEDTRSYIVRVATMIRDAALAVAHVHEREVLHRDIKPANLMLTADASRLVLMDFGLARLAASDITDASQKNKVGTLRYMAPEQLQVREIDQRVDVRALGVTLWEFLARKRVFSDIEEDEPLRTAILDQDLPRLRAIDPTIPKDLDAIVSRATERVPDDRIASAELLARHLDDFIQGKELTIRPRSGLEKLIRLASEHKLASSLAAGFMLAIAGWAVTFTILRNMALVAENSARGAVNEFYVEVSENDLLNQPGLKELRASLLQKARDYYEEFLKRPLARRDLLLEIAKTHYRVGVVTQALEGHAAATEHYDNAWNALQNLPESEARDLFRSNVWNRRGEASQMEAGQSAIAALEARKDAQDQARFDQTIKLFNDAVTRYGKAETFRHALSQKNLSNAKYARLLANSIMNQAQAKLAQIEFKKNYTERDPGDSQALVDIESELERAQGIRTDKLASPDQGGVDRTKDTIDVIARLKRDRGKGYLNLGKLYKFREKYESMLQSAKQATEDFDILLKGEPSNTELQYLAAQAYMQQGNASMDLNDPRARPFYNAIELLLPLVRQNPAELAYRRELIRAHNDLAVLLNKKKMPIAALHYSEFALNSFDQATKHRYVDLWSSVSSTNASLRKNASNRFQYAYLRRQITWYSLDIADEAVARKGIEMSLLHLKQIIDKEGISNSDIAAEAGHLLSRVQVWKSTFPDEAFDDLEKLAKDVMNLANSNL